jgi:hypothetical protein
MSAPFSWHSLTLQAFFAHANWEGRSQLESHRSTSDSAQSQQRLDPSSWMSLTLQDFFSRHNWQGASFPTTDSAQRMGQTSQGQLIDPLTVSVHEFLQWMVWEGQPEIAKMPFSSPIQDHLPTPEPGFTLNDLSNLF